MLLMMMMTTTKNAFQEMGAHLVEGMKDDVCDFDGDDDDEEEEEGYDVVDDDGDNTLQ